MVAAALLAPSIALAATACHDTPGYYTDVDGDSVHRPVCATGALPGLEKDDF